jgi:predicted NBD/HSP70 family sugar kinase
LYKLNQDIAVQIKTIPELDPGFIPVEAFVRAFEKTAKKQIVIAITGNEDMTYCYEAMIHGSPEMEAADAYYIEIIVKFLIWSRGGNKIAVCGDDRIAAYIKKLYAHEGKRSFDYHFMSRVYEKEFQVLSLTLEEVPEEKEVSQNIGRHLSGCRIGFDAGGSDRKVSAVVDGVSVYSEEVVWFPKTEENPDYHYDEILKSFQTAASKMPRVDAIGVSSAGIYIGNKTMIASLFLKVPEDRFDEKIKNIYERAARQIGEIPLVVANDGDVTALAGSMSLNVNCILGIAMGTSQAVGYIDCNGRITGWLNELAFAPVDLQEEADIDEWSKDYGVGCKYFSQDAVIRLALKAGLEVKQDLPLAEKLKTIQDFMEAEDPRAAAVYRSIGAYLGHTIPLYDRFYHIEHILLMGRVTSGKGGAIIVDTAKNVMKEEYPDVYAKVSLSLPDEKSRRVGQSIAAASLPPIEGESS